MGSTLVLVKMTAVGQDAEAVVGGPAFLDIVTLLLI